MANRMSPLEILDLPMSENDAEAKTVRDYLKALLTTLWEEGEGFSGKRPFGNSGWENELFSALVKGKAVKGAFDEDDLYDVDEKAARKAIQAAIEALQ